VIRAALTPAVDTSRNRTSLPIVLSLIAGSTDVVGFLGLGLFTAHITGNLVVLTAHVVLRGDRGPLAPMLAVPVFMVVLALTRLLVGRCAALDIDARRPLLLSQFLLLAGAFVLGIAGASGVEPNGRYGILAGMLAVSAMAVQNALLQLTLMQAPTTVAMTGNVTRLTLDVVEMLVGHDSKTVASARRRARQTWPVVAGFAVGCVLGAACHAAIGLWALALPTSLALLAIGWASRAMISPAMAPGR
jgi:uncharacterized membrane protein YoaK (UPF0700 family)